MPHTLPRNRPVHYRTAPTQRRCVEAVRNGESITHVARREGVPYATLHGWCRRAGVVSAHPHGGAYNVPQRRAA